MILFEIDSQGYVTSTPSLIPQGMALSDIVIITESDYELVTLRLIPPSGRYIPDVVCTPVKTQDKSATLWQALLPAEASAMHGVLTYQIFRRNVQGRVIPTQEGALTVQRGVISDMPENVEHLETYSIESLYNLLSQINAKCEDHDRGIDKNASDIAALDERVTANADEIADNAERIETNAENHLQLQDRLYGEDGDVPSIRDTLTEHGGHIENLMGDVADNREGLAEVRSDLANFLDVSDDKRDQLSEVLGLIAANEQAIQQFVSMGGAPVGSGTLVVPASEWSDGSPTTAFVDLPGNTLRAGSVMLLTPANDATKEAASKARLSVSVDTSGDYPTSSTDTVFLLRAAGNAKPAIDMEFAYVILQTTATTSLVTLIGVDAAGDPEPTLVDLSRFDPDENGKGYITETYGEGEDATTKEIEVTYDAAGNIIKIGNTAINWGEEG